MRFLAISILCINIVFGGNSTFLKKHSEVADAITVLDIWLTEQIAYRDMPSLTIGIVYDQELIWAKGYGFADIENQVKATPETLYRIGSITKTFTATAVMMLRDAGMLKLDDPVKQYLPWFMPRNSFEDAPEITVRHLITHTSGLPRESAYPYWTTHEFPSVDEIKAAIVEQELIYAPGSTHKYSNLGVSILGLVVEAAAGMPYHQYIEDNIFTPLGMTNSSIVAPEQTAQLAKPYFRKLDDGSRPEGYFLDAKGISPAANLASNVQDMARYASLQLREGPAGGDQILRGSTLAEMHRPQWVYGSWTGGRGLGFGISYRNGKNIVSHGGWAGTHRTHLMFNVDEKIAVIVLTNADDSVPYDFSYEAYDAVAPAIVKATTPASKVAKAQKRWQKYVGRYIDSTGWEYEVMILNNRLAVYEHNYPPDDGVWKNISFLKPLQGDSFLMADGETMTFEMGKDGKVVRIKRRYEYLDPVE